MIGTFGLEAVRIVSLRKEAISIVGAPIAGMISPRYVAVKSRYV